MRCRRRRRYRHVVPVVDDVRYDGLRHVRLVHGDVDVGLDDVGLDHGHDDGHNTLGHDHRGYQQPDQHNRQHREPHSRHADREVVDRYLDVRHDGESEVSVALAAPCWGDFYHGQPVEPEPARRHHNDVGRTRLACR